MAGEALYQRVKRDLLDRIAGGTWPAGTYIPSETDLQQRYRVSRTTIRRAIADLVDDGVLTIIHGMGTRVAAGNLAFRPSEQMSFTQMMRARGIEPGQASSSASVVEASDEVASALGVHPGDEVLCYERVRTADGQPVSRNISFLPLDLFAGRDLGRLGDEQSLYATLDGFNLPIAAIEDTFGVVKADADTARLLEVKPGEPLLLIVRLAHDKNERPVEFSRIQIRSDRYRHTITIRKK